MLMLLPNPLMRRTTVLVHARCVAMRWKRPHEQDPVAQLHATLELHSRIGSFEDTEARDGRARLQMQD